MTYANHDWRKSGELSNISAEDLRMGDLIADGIGIAIVCVILAFGYGLFN